MLNHVSITVDQRFGNVVKWSVESTVIIVIVSETFYQLTSFNLNSVT